MKRPFFALSLAIATVLAATSCERNSYSVFSKKYPVLFTCDCSTAPYNQLTTPSRFLAITKSAGKLAVTEPDGHKTTLELSAVQNSAFSLGLAGLILGTPCFNNDAQEIWAYDLGCPVCDVSQARLSITAAGMATCPKCSRQWDLNNSGFPTADESRPLYRYPVSRTSNNIRVDNH